jgi:molybdenum cofactor guanylyltransferase
MDRAGVTVQIMVGGRSTRMGRDKALVELEGKTLLQRALDTWKNYGKTVQLSVGTAERAALAPAGVPAVADRYRDCGPLGGLHAGLLECRTELLLLAAVDCPFVTTALADGLLAAIDGADACVYTVDGRPQPLFGLYRRTCLAPASEMLAAGERKMGELLRRVETVRLPAADPAPFRNLNTPEELAREQLCCNRAN